MKKILLTLLYTTLLSQAGEINIAVAANVSSTMNDLLKEFNVLYPETKVQVTLGSSGKLTAQIKNGAPYQIFMSADMGFPDVLYKENDAVTRPLIYAQGSLAYLSNKKQDFNKGIKLLESPEIAKIAIANPKTAPYGTAALEAIKNAGILAKVENKFVYAESISQVVSYSVTAADIGIIAKSSLYDSKMSMYKEGENWAEVDSKLYTPIDQGIVLLKNAEANAEAAAFYAFILSKKAKEIFQKYGYTVP